MKTKLVALGIVLGLLAIAPSANAAMITFQASNCSNCQGGVYTLVYDPLTPDTSNGTIDTYSVLLQIDTSGYNGGGTFIDAVAFKVSPSVTNTALVSAPGDTWNIVAGGINAGGCSGSGGGYECADWIGSGAGIPVPVASVYTWEFAVSVASGTALFSGENGLPSIKARYVDDAGNKVGALVSTTAQVPEPTSLLLLGTGLLGAGFFGRRRRK